MSPNVSDGMPSLLYFTGHTIPIYSNPRSETGTTKLEDKGSEEFSLDGRNHYQQNELERHFTESCQKNKISENVVDMALAWNISHINYYKRFEAVVFIFHVINLASIFQQQAIRLP